MSTETDPATYVANMLAQHRFGPGLDMGGAHNPTFAEERLAERIVREITPMIVATATGSAQTQPDHDPYAAACAECNALPGHWCTDATTGRQTIHVHEERAAAPAQVQP